MGIDSSGGTAAQMSGIRHYMALAAVKQAANTEAMAPVAAMEQAVKNANELKDNSVPVSKVKGQKLDITI